MAGKKFDPNLREAVEEIRAICKRRNIAAHVLLSSDTHAEFALLYDIPSWSVVSFEDTHEEIGVRIRAKSSRPGDHEKLNATMHMLCTFQDMMHNAFGVLETLVTVVRGHVNVFHLSRRDTPPDSVPE